MRRDLAGQGAASRLIDGLDDADLHRLMTNLAGHDLPSLIRAFDEGRRGRRRPPPLLHLLHDQGPWPALRGHKDNHAGLMNAEQMAGFREAMGIAEGEEWEPFAGLEDRRDDLARFLKAVPFASEFPRRRQGPRIAVPAGWRAKAAENTSTHTSTQSAFGQILNEIGRGDSELARRIVTTSPDVAVSTNLEPGSTGAGCSIGAGMSTPSGPRR